MEILKRMREIMKRNHEMMEIMKRNHDEMMDIMEKIIRTNE